MGERDPYAHLSPDFVVALCHTLASSLDAYVAVVDRQRHVLFLNRVLSRDFSDVLGKKMEEFTAAAGRESMIASVEQAFVTGVTQTHEFAASLADGSTRHMRTRVTPFQGPRRKEVALLVTEDLTTTRQLSEQPTDSMAFRRLVIEYLPDFVAVLDRDLRYVWVNRLAAGLKMEQVIGESLERFVSPDTLQQARSTIQRAFAEGTVGQYEAEAYADGELQGWSQTRVVPVVVEGKVTNVILLTADITERKKAERTLSETAEQLQRAQRLESIGQLAGGIAHDFNNLLQVLEGTLHFAKQALEHGEPALEEVEQALKATERAAELTSHLLAIGRRKRMDPKCVNLGELILRSLPMLRRAVPENVELTFHPPDEPCYAELDVQQFEQVLINLCVNARDAMHRGGNLEIRVEHEGASGLVLSVSDTGEGIPSQNLGRVFEPFFTTKGAGSGLGLAVASGIVAVHGGVLSAESEVGSGTTMKIRLARVEPGAAAPQAPQSESSRRPGVILVAEDEQLVRRQLVRMLEAGGYQVLQAEDGARALELFKSHKDDIDLVLLDVIMPELDGWNAFLEMEKLKPGLKVLFSTGYAANVLPRDFAARGASVLSKPYKARALLTQVKTALGQRFQK